MLNQTETPVWLWPGQQAISRHPRARLWQKVSRSWASPAPHHWPAQSGGAEGLWDHIEAKANGGEDVPENLHLISARLNATIGDANTREWALANGYGPLKVEPPYASALAQLLLLPSWNGRDVTAETTLRLARARIEILSKKATL